MSVPHSHCVYRSLRHHKKCNPPRDPYAFDPLRKPAKCDECLPGHKGQKGDKGTVGDKGQKGEKGQMGDKGQKGQKGQKGDMDEKGMRGLQGDKGFKGELGTGDKGQKGDKGDKGQLGETGDKGEQGNTGPAGLLMPQCTTLARASFPLTVGGTTDLSWNGGDILTVATSGTAVQLVGTTLRLQQSGTYILHVQGFAASEIAVVPPHKDVQLQFLAGGTPLSTGSTSVVARAGDGNGDNMSLLQAYSPPAAPVDITVRLTVTPATPVTTTTFTDVTFTIFRVGA